MVGLTRFVSVDASRLDFGQNALDTVVDRALFSAPPFRDRRSGHVLNAERVLAHRSQLPAALLAVTPLPAELCSVTAAYLAWPWDFPERRADDEWDDSE